MVPFAEVLAGAHNNAEVLSFLARIHRMEQFSKMDSSPAAFVGAFPRDIRTGPSQMVSLHFHLRLFVISPSQIPWMRAGPRR